MATAGQYYRGYATYVLLSWASLLHQYCFFFYLHKIHIFSIDIILLCFWFCFTPETGWEWGLQEKLGSVQGRIWTSVSRWYHWVLAGQWKNSFNNYAVHSAICLTNRTGGLERQKRVFAHDASENDSLKPTAPTAASVCTALWKKRWALRPVNMHSTLLWLLHSQLLQQSPSMTCCQAHMRAWRPRAGSPSLFGRRNLFLLFKFLHIFCILWTRWSL